MRQYPPVCGPLFNSTFIDLKCNGQAPDDVADFAVQKDMQDKCQDVKPTEALSVSIEDEEESLGCPARVARIKEKQMILRGEITREELEMQRVASRVRRPV